MQTKAKQSFVMYDTFFEAADRLDDKSFRECITRIRRYALFGEDEESENTTVNIILGIAKPLLDKSKKRYEKCIENGSKGKDYGWLGGRPKKNTKPQEEPLNVYVNDYENDNDNVNEKVYDNPNGYVKENESLHENGNDVSVQDSIINKGSVDSIANQNQSKDKNHLQVEDDFISSQETEDNLIGSSNSCLSIQKSNENDGFMDALFEFQDLDG